MLIARKSLTSQFLRPQVRLFAAKASGYSFSNALSDLPETKVSILNNKVKVASEDNGSDIATIGVFIESGSRHENEKNNGASRLLQNLAFRGTQKRTQDALQTEIANLGGNFSAQSGREQTAYIAQVLKKDVSKAMEILSDVVQNTAFSPAAFEEERQKLLKEYNSEGQPDQLVMDHLHATAFQGTSLALSPIGTDASLKSISKADLESFVQQQFTGGRIVVAGAGGVSHDELSQLAEKGFGGLSAGGEIKPLSGRVTGSEIRLRDDELANIYISFGVQGASWTSPDFLPLLVAQQVMGSWDRTLGGGKNLSSKLAQNIASLGFCQYYESFLIPYSNTGLFGFSVVSNDPTQIDTVMFNFQNDWVRICVNATDAEVDRAKTQLLSMNAQLHQRSLDTCKQLGSQILHANHRVNLKELSQNLASIDASTVRKVAFKYLYDKDPALVGYGPIEALPDYNRIQTANSWLRV